MGFKGLMRFLKGLVRPISLNEGLAWWLLPLNARELVSSARVSSLVYQAETWLVLAFDIESAKPLLL